MRSPTTPTAQPLAPGACSLWPREKSPRRLGTEEILRCAVVPAYIKSPIPLPLTIYRQRPQDCKPSPRERRLQFTDEGLQNRSAAAVRAYSTSNSTYGSGRTFDEYPPRHLATTARWDSCRAMCTSSPVCNGRPARGPSGCDWPRLAG